MSKKKPDYQSIGQQIEAYCRKYSIPLEHFSEILNNQKVLPMLRGKGMEYNAFIAVNKVLDSNEWTVHKLNSNAQPRTTEQDISVIHRRSGISLGIESKSAVRGSMTTGGRARLHRGLSHFKVKCHRSRSNIRLAGSSNDRYRVDAFDVIVTTPYNALFKGATIDDNLELLDAPALIKALYSHYGMSTGEGLLTL